MFAIIMIVNDEIGSHYCKQPLGTYSTSQKLEDGQTGHTHLSQLLNGTVRKLRKMDCYSNPVIS